MYLSALSSFTSLISQPSLAVYLTTKQVCISGLKFSLINVPPNELNEKKKTNKKQLIGILTYPLLLVTRSCIRVSLLQSSPEGLLLQVGNSIRCKSYLTKLYDQPISIFVYNFKAFDKNEA